MRIAIASSGLGHVARGVETWALDTAVALSNAHVIGYPLFVNREDKDGVYHALKSTNNKELITNNSLNVTLFCGSPLAHPVNFHVEMLPCLMRGERMAKRLARIMPGFTWRWGWKDTYGWEQFTFWLLLWPQLRRGKYDILHVQDPMVAYWCRLFRKWGLVKAKEILAHGTEEPLEFLAKFDYVQHLAPWHLNQTADHRPQPALHSPVFRDGAGTTDLKRKKWVTIPNFVDCAVFRPAAKAVEKQAIRDALGIPEDAFVVGCVAAVKKYHKRIDYLVREFARFYDGNVAQKTEEFKQKATKTAKEENCLSAGGGEQNPPLRTTVQNSFPLLPFLLIAGAETGETVELLALAESLIPGRYKILTNCSRSQMPDLLRAMDVFVLTSLFEMMPIALLEALASGLPCVVNKHPVLEWMIGAEGGMAIGMSQEGALAQALADLTPERLALHGRQARERALMLFSTETVIGQYVEYYWEVRGA